MLLAGPPSEAVEVPASVARLAGRGPLRPVWENELGGLTFAVDSERRYIKWAPASSGIDLAAASERLRWAAAFTPVPRVMEQAADEHGSWLVLTALPGENAISDRIQKTIRVARRPSPALRPDKQRMNSTASISITSALSPRA